MPEPPTRCVVEGCLRTPRMALTTTRPHRHTLKTTIFFDDRSAPRTARRYCKTHGAEMTAGLIQTVVSPDEEPRPA